MASRTPDPIATNDVESRDAKCVALNALLQACPGSAETTRQTRAYLDAAARYSVEVFTEACALVLATWVDTFRGPSPGHVCAACQNLDRQSRVSRQRMLDHARVEAAKRNTITAGQAHDEIRRLRNLPAGTDPYPPPVPDEMPPAFHDRVTAKTIASLERFIEAHDETEQML